MELTIFELHLPEAQFNAPFAAGSTREEADEDPTGAAGGPKGKGPKLAPLAMVVVLLGLAAFARYLKRPTQAELDEFEG